jgi:ethanolamine ammonia-lyase small subunit
MVQENDIKQMVKEILQGMVSGGEATPVAAAPVANGDAELLTTGWKRQPVIYEDGFVEDISAKNTKEQYFVPNAVDKAGYLHMKTFTPARIGVWRAGPRYNTYSMLRFRADHATAQDAVFTDVPDEFVAKNGFVAGQSLCNSRDEFLTRPDYGRKLNDATKALFAKELPKNPKVLLMVGDGLSSAAIEANMADVIPALKQGLKQYGIEINVIPYVKYCRVGAMDEVGPITGADVVCLLIGERPGLVTAESMSAYMAYKPSPDRPESWRTVVSNIHKGGTPAAEAGAHIASLLKRILDEKVSGVDLAL